MAETKWTAEDVREKLAYRGLLAAALRRDSIDAALVFAWRDAIPALQQAGVRVAIEKLDGPSLIGKLADKSGFDRVVAESRTVRDDLLKRVTDFGLTEDQVEFIYPGIDLSSFDPLSIDRDAMRAELGISPDDFVVGTVGRLIPDKNVKLVVKAFATLAARSAGGGESRLLICGPDGGALPELRELAAALGVESRTLFLPPTTQVSRILAAIDVFAMTSLREGLPTALLEAMAMGLPIVTTGVGSIPEVLRGNGFLLPGYAAEGIGQRLARLWEDAELRHSQGVLSRSIATRFAARHSVGRYEELVLECLAGKPPHPSPLPAGADWPAEGDWPRTLDTATKAPPPRILVLLDGLEDSHRDLLPALAGQVELALVWLRRPSERRLDPPTVGKLKYRARIDLDPSPKFEVLCAGQIALFNPDLVYLTPARDEGVAARLRLMLNTLPPARRPRLVRSLRAIPCRDWSGTSTPPDEFSARRLPLGDLADGWVFESAALRDRACAQRGIDPLTTLVVPTSLSLAKLAAPGPRLSEEDCRVHLAVSGHLSGSQENLDWWLTRVRELCQAGFVVYSFFTGDDLAIQHFQELSRTCPDYHCEAPLDPQEGVEAAQRLARLDLAAIFTAVTAGEGSLPEDLGVPLQAIQAWLLAGIPIVCDRRQPGLADWITQFGWGFVLEDLSEAGELLNRRHEIETATQACLERRTLLSAETQAVRLAWFFRRMISLGAAGISEGFVQP